MLRDLSKGSPIEPTGMTCTDSGTGHFFRVSRESYQLG